MVINYDFPDRGGAEDYVHRIGRTGRGDGDGLAYSFVTPSDVRASNFSELIDVVQRSGQPVPPEIMGMISSRGSVRARQSRGAPSRSGGGYGGGGGYGSSGGRSGGGRSYGDRNSGGSSFGDRNSGGGSSFDRRSGGSKYNSHGDEPSAFSRAVGSRDRDGGSKRF